MIRQKPIIILIIFLIISPIISSLNIKSSNNIKISEESHTICDVPYISQETSYYCAFASNTMVINYYNRNSSLKEVLHHSGVGYSSAYRRFLSPARLQISSNLLSQSSISSKFLAELYNLSFSFSISDNWEDYWTKVKQNITNDIPIITSVNACIFPFYKNLGYNGTSGHAIVIVGFNKTHIIYNDPATTLYTCEEDGTYANITIEIFKEAVNTTLGTKYLIFAFKNESYMTTTKEERFEKAHNRNIRLIKGEKKAYFGNIQNPSFYLGINAIKTFRKDLRMGVTHRFSTILFYKLFISLNANLSSTYKTISLEKNNISQYLFKLSNSFNDEKLSLLCKHDASLLLHESNSWLNFSKIIANLEVIIRNNNFLKILFFSFPYTLKMKKVLNEIIEIENKIICGVKSLSK